MQTTEFVPTGNTDPLGGSHNTVLPKQLSVTLVVNGTTASHRPGLVLVIISEGQTTRGLSQSCTSTVNAHVAVLLLASVAVQFTAVRPRANLVPAGGTH